jgi:hypothetical protein
MQSVQSVLKHRYNVNAEIKHGMIVGDNGFTKVQVEPPCQNPNCREDQKKWLLRMAPSQSFDRWSVSAAVSERFDRIEQIVEYLYNSSKVYAALFNKLSADYKELDEQYENLAYSDCE